jgi:hypothetical protein
VSERSTFGEPFFVRLLKAGSIGFVSSGRLTYIEGRVPSLSRGCDELVQGVALEASQSRERQIGKNAAFATPICALAATINSQGSIQDAQVVA